MRVEILFKDNGQVSLTEVTDFHSFGKNFYVTYRDEDKYRTDKFYWIDMLRIEIAVEG